MKPKLIPLLLALVAASVGIAKAGDVIPYDQLDSKPALVRNVRPLYPAELKQKGIAGEAVISFVVDASGTTTGVLVDRATHEAFGIAAAEAVRQWQFTPGTKDGRAVECRVTVPIVFRPDGAPAKP
ncbi:hypothetical protein DB347_04995 [Opitutaceae bacterium EW11]|nr:hypothetical protein DB347_04995 [Opitutaceae bacterium EW11]